MSELSQLLKQNEKLPGCVTEKLFTYALGKGDLEKQACDVLESSTRFSEGGYRLRDLIHSLTKSQPFRQRRGDPGVQ